MTFETFDTIATTVFLAVPSILTVIGLAYMVKEKM
jgi:hypothetical protein